MPTIAHDCPHCGTVKTAFKLDYSERCRLQGTYFAALGLCGVCKGPLLMEFHHPSGLQTAPHGLQDTTFAKESKLFNAWPLPVAPKLPAHTPDKILDVLREAESNRARKKEGVHAASMMYGKVLDLATKAVSSDADKSKSLFERIGILGAAGKITSDLAGWMQTLRGVRNDAAHDDDALTVDEVETLGEATQLLLQYLFTLPGMLSGFKAEQDNAKAAKAAAKTA